MKPRFIATRADELRQDLKILKPIVRRLARAAGPRAGITVANLKLYLSHHEVALASTQSRYRGALFGRVMVEAGLAKTGEKRHTPRVFGGNFCALWTLPEWATRQQRRSTRRAA